MDQKLESRQSQFIRGATVQIRADADGWKSINLTRQKGEGLVLVETR